MNYSAPIEETIGMEIYNRYVRYCTEVKAIPNPYVFWEKVLVEIDKYPISRSGFTHWLIRLQIPDDPQRKPYIWKDPRTKAWRLRDIDVTELNV